MPLTNDALPAAREAWAGSPELLLGELLEHRSAIFRVCLGFAARAADAEDLTHDIYERALRHADRLQGPEHARRWLFHVARNACLDYRRRLAVRRLCAPLLAGTEEAATDLQRDAERDEQLEGLKEAMRRLPRRLHEVLVLREYGGLAYDEIAAQLRLSPGTVMSRLHRARARLRLMLEESR